MECQLSIDVESITAPFLEQTIAPSFRIPIAPSKKDLTSKSSFVGIAIFAAASSIFNIINSFMELLNAPILIVRPLKEYLPLILRHYDPKETPYQVQDRP